eukprot:GHVO01002614.1.p1 GENE.GHVO01002614.1~~GHVO01002614.1.p1  ORF type:complete len:207 (+),score=44.36 GHVO01002614.1:296-916(+)
MSMSSGQSSTINPPKVRNGCRMKRAVYHSDDTHMTPIHLCRGDDDDVVMTVIDASTPDDVDVYMTPIEESPIPDDVVIPEMMTVNGKVSAPPQTDHISLGTVTPTATTPCDKAAPQQLIHTSAVLKVRNELSAPNLECEKEKELMSKTDRQQLTDNEKSEWKEYAENLMYECPPKQSLTKNGYRIRWEQRDMQLLMFTSRSAMVVA